MTAKIKISKKELTSLINKGLTNQEIADFFGVHRITIDRRRKAYNISHPRWVKDKPSEHQLINHIKLEGLNDREIAKIYKCSYNTIAREREKYNLLCFVDWRKSLLPNYWYCSGFNMVLPVNHFTPRKDTKSYLQYSRLYGSMKSQDLARKCKLYLGGECKVCGLKDESMLEFHHLDPKSKTHSISNMIGNQIPFEEIVLELNKCQLFCANHHRELHYAERKKQQEEELLFINNYKYINKQELEGAR